MRMLTRAQAMDFCEDSEPNSRSGYMLRRLKDDPWVGFVLVLGGGEAMRPGGGMRITELEAWCREQCRGRFKHLCVVAVGFEREEDAVLCKTFNAEAP